MRAGNHGIPGPTAAPDIDQRRARRPPHGRSQALRAFGGIGCRGIAREQEVECDGAVIPTLSGKVRGRRAAVDAPAPARRHQRPAVLVEAAPDHAYRLLPTNGELACPFRGKAHRCQRSEGQRFPALTGQAWPEADRAGEGWGTASQNGCGNDRCWRNARARRAAMQRKTMQQADRRMQAMTDVHGPSYTAAPLPDALLAKL